MHIQMILACRCYWEVKFFICIYFEIRILKNVESMKSKVSIWFSLVPTEFHTSMDTFIHSLSFRFGYLTFIPENTSAVFDPWCSFQIRSREIPVSIPCNGHFGSYFIISKLAKVRSCGKLRPLVSITHQQRARRRTRVEQFSILLRCCVAIIRSY